MMKNAKFTYIFLYLLTACTSIGTHPDETPEISSVNSAQEALRPYYASLRQTLPVAPTGPFLDEKTPITRFAFGSCVNQNRAMEFWDVIADQNPQLFLFIGDNVYGDINSNFAADMPMMGNSYRMLNSRQEFFRFREHIPMMTMWDDHDFGAADGGASFAFKEYSEKLYENFWGASGDVRGRPGVYEARTIGPPGKRVQFILLDTRFFRSDIARRPDQNPPPPLGSIIPNMDPQATMLGDVQWQWLARELTKPANLRFIISSTQVISSAHGFEGWYNFPNERTRLYALLAEKNVGNAVFLSGDRHSGAFYKDQPLPLHAPIWEFTSSSLNVAYGNGDSGAREPDNARIGGFWSIANFGQIDIDWAKKTVKMSMKKTNGELIEETIITPID